MRKVLIDKLEVVGKRIFVKGAVNIEGEMVSFYAFFVLKEKGFEVETYSLAPKLSKKELLSIIKENLMVHS